MTKSEFKSSRRGLLHGLGVASGAALFGAAPVIAAGDEPVDEANRQQPFYGAYQSGIITPQPSNGMIVAFDVLAADRTALERLFRTLTDRAAILTQGGPIPEHDPLLPPPDSGLMGSVVKPDNLTMTFAVGASLFDHRFGLASQRPSELLVMDRFTNDSLDPAYCHGDLLIQFCSHNVDTNIHALRDIIKSTPDLLSVRWKMEGFLPPKTVKQLGKDTARNMLGFKDGTANIDAGDPALMDALVWVQPQSAKPAWTAGGSYQVVRIIRNKVERWDRTPLHEQEKIIGRHKMSGAPLGKTDERVDPDYISDPQGERIKLDAHIRLANPRTVETAGNRILRRGYNYSRGVTNAGQLDMGLLFVCFQSSLDAGFLSVQKRLNGEQLEEYIKPTGGGYFFALPGVKSKDSFLAEEMLKV